MFINSSDYRQPDTVIHEFGHYYNFYLMPELKWNDNNNLDAAEIHSQALELLMQPYYDQFFGQPIRRNGRMFFNLQHDQLDSAGMRRR